MVKAGWLAGMGKTRSQRSEVEEYSEGDNTLMNSEREGISIENR